MIEDFVEIEIESDVNGCDGTHLIIPAVTQGMRNPDFLVRCLKERVNEYTTSDCIADICKDTFEAVNYIYPYDSKYKLYTLSIEVKEMLNIPCGQDGMSWDLAKNREIKIYGKNSTQTYEF